MSMPHDQDGPFDHFPSAAAPRTARKLVDCLGELAHSSPQFASGGSVQDVMSRIAAADVFADSRQRRHRALARGVLACSTMVIAAGVGVAVWKWPVITGQVQQQAALSEVVNATEQDLSTALRALRGGRPARANTSDASVVAVAGIESEHLSLSAGRSTRAASSLKQHKIDAALGIPLHSVRATEAASAGTLMGSLTAAGTAVPAQVDEPPTEVPH